MIFMNQLADLLSKAIQGYIYLIIAYIILGFFPDARRYRIYHIIKDICDPFLNVFRFATISGMNFSPILAIFVLRIILMLLSAMYG